ncbi:Hypothetical Protein FCC1311_092692 [Hondaea fermentalgiana]|uniref:Uncharacterized protein n=1 Tax=Hondaea fermentalgiana TaxID=2315210 RepID=A0A2R5GR26_9STRA|nr:Hypothetical Protein FCC1311_092692 [Hondaea fermentalgiana]|eukprot:GBG33045.1 Hypothetical Protein FCC1311_092692 [Hondaea fermentalgiana]
MSGALPGIMNFRGPLEVRSKEQKAKVTTLEGQLRQANQQGEKRGKDIRRLKEKLRTQDAELQQVRDEAEARVQEVEAELARVREQLEGELKDATAAAAANQQGKHTAEEKKRNAVRAMKREKELREQAEAALMLERKRIDKLEHHSVRVQKVKKQGETALREAHLATEAAENRSRGLEEECDRLRADLESAQADHAALVDELRAQVREVSAREDEALERVKTLERDALTAKQNLEDARQTADSAKRVQHAAEERASVAKNRIGKLEAELAQVTERLTRTSSELEDLKKQNDEREEEAKNAEGLPTELTVPESEGDLLARIRTALEQRNISLDFLLKSASETPASHTPLKTPESLGLPRKARKSVIGASLRSPKVVSAVTKSKVAKREQSTRRLSSTNNKLAAKRAARTVGGPSAAVGSKKTSAVSEASDPAVNKKTKVAEAKKARAAESSVSVPRETKATPGANSGTEARDDNGPATEEPSEQKQEPVMQRNMEEKRSASPNQRESEVETETRHADVKQSSRPKSATASSAGIPSKGSSNIGSEESARRAEKQRKMQQQRREEREQLQKQYQQQKKLQQQQQQERVRRARSKSIEKAQRNAVMAIEETEQPSKLEIGANLFDIAPQPSHDSPPRGELEGDFDSLLYPRPDKGWKRSGSNIATQREELHL